MQGLGPRAAWVPSSPQPARKESHACQSIRIFSSSAKGRLGELGCLSYKGHPNCPSLLCLCLLDVLAWRGKNSS
jgi:hypothetical protein